MSDTTRTGVRQREGQTTAQILTFAAEENRALAIKIAESPKIVLAAAVLAFKLLDPEIQIEMIAKARVAHLRALNDTDVPADEVTIVDFPAPDAEPETVG